MARRILEVEERGGTAEESRALRTLMGVREAEVRKLSRELHDGLGGMLATVRGGLVGRLPPEDAAFGLLDQACRDIRRIANDLLPQHFGMTGFRGAVEDLAVQLEQSGLLIDLEIFGHPGDKLTEGRQLILLRILRELCLYSLRQDGAERIFVQLLVRTGHLLVTVEDNGTGLPAEDPDGLAGIVARVGYLAGQLQRDRCPGNGTTTTISIPL